MEIHIHHSDEVYTDGGTLLQKQPTHPLKMQALSLVQEALRQSPGDYAFMLNFWQPLAVFKKNRWARDANCSRESQWGRKVDCLFPH